MFSFANPWGLLGLLALPTIAFIHLYQRRFPPLEIAGLHLWGVQQQTKAAGTRLDRLPITQSLLLELLIALLLTLILARPTSVQSNTATHWVFVLDNSASMMAANGDGDTFRELALNEMRRRMESGGGNSRASILLSGRRPTMLAGPSVDWETARGALNDWQPQGTHHDFQPAWDMGAQLVEESGRLLFLTDQLRPDAPRPVKMEVVSVGQPLSNIAFEAARWSIDRDSLQGQLYLRIRNYADRNVSGELVGTAQGNEVLRQDLELLRLESRAYTFQLPGGIGQLELRFDAVDDRLETDSRLQLVEPKLRKVKMAIALDEERPAHRHLINVIDSVNGVDIVSDNQADFFCTAADAELDLAKDRWWLAIGPLEESEEAREASKATAGPFLIERRNPLLEGLSLQGVIWGGIQKNDLPLSPMISSGNWILMGRRTDLRGTAFVLNVDLAASNLAETPDWPILISNLLEGCRDSRPGLRRWNYHVNEPVVFDLDLTDGSDAADRPLQLKRGESVRELVRGETVEIPGLPSTGLYEVVDGGRVLGRFAVNFFDSQESDLSELEAGHLEPEQRGEAQIEIQGMAPWIWMLLIGAVLISCLWNWRSLQRGDRHYAQERHEATAP